MLAIQYTTPYLKCLNVVKMILNYINLLAFYNFFIESTYFIYKFSPKMPPSYVDMRIYYKSTSNLNPKNDGSLFIFHAKFY